MKIQSPPQSKVRHLGLTWVFACSLGLFSCGLNPNSTTFEGKEISHLSIIFKGETSIDESRYRGLILSQPGTKYSSPRLDDDIKSLWCSGYVEDARFLAEPEGERIKLIVEITPYPPMGPCRMVIIGHTAFSDLKLAKISGLKFNKKPTKAQIETARRNIGKFYQSSGYQDAKVTLTHPWKDKGDDDTFAFLIEEGSKRQP